MWFEPKLFFDFKKSFVNLINTVIIAIISSYCQFTLAASIDPEILEELMLSGEAEVIIALHDPVAIDAPDRIRLARIAAVQKSVLEALPSTSFELRHQYRYLPGLSATMTQAALVVLQNHPEVKGVALNEADFIALTESNAVIGADVLHTSAPPIHYTGNDVVVAVLDTGIDTDHPDLAHDIIETYCPIKNCQSAEDEHNHGSHVSGIITSDHYGDTPLGVAPDAKIVAIKICDSSGACLVDDTIKSLDWLRERLNTLKIKIVNLSIAGNHYLEVCDDENVDNQLYQQAINQLKIRGVSVFAATGNQGLKNEIARPACLSSAFAVGATYDANLGNKSWKIGIDDLGNGIFCDDFPMKVDQVSCFSNSNKLVDLLAPGAQIISSALYGSTTEESGTSMAAPMAAGVAALMLEANPGLTPDEILTVMQNSGIDVKDSKNNLSFKRVNAYASVLEVRPGQLQFASSSHSFSEDTGQVTIEVSRVNGSYGTVRVDYQITDDTTRYGEDYQAIQTGTLTWNAGETTKTIELDIEDDHIYEGIDELLSISLTNPTPDYVSINTPHQVTLNIIDNEIPSAGVFQLSQNEYFVQEGSGDLTITVSRILGSVGNVSVNYQTFADTATADNDYTAVSDTLSWADGDDGDKQFTIPILDNEQFEVTEHFNIFLSDPINAALLNNHYFATVTIEDDDPMPLPEESIEEPPAVIEVIPLKFTVSVDIAGSGSGSVISDPVGIQCNNRALSSCTRHPSDFVFHCLAANNTADDSCRAEFERQTLVTLIPQADADSVFIGWGGALDCADGTFNVLSNQYCTAYMSALYTLTITPSQFGQVKSYNDARQPTGIECALASRDHCAQRFHDGQFVVLEANPEAGAQFLGWFGDCSGKQPTMLVEMLAHKTCQAQFAQLK